MANLLAQKYAKTVLPRKIKKPTPFTSLVPMDTIVNRPAVQQFAYSRVDPEVNRERGYAHTDLMNQLGSTGGLRFGTAQVKQQRLSDYYSRMREEMAQPYMDQGLGILQDYYNDLMDEYYRDPQAFEYNPIDINSMLGGPTTTPTNTGQATPATPLLDQYRTGTGTLGYWT